ncbi:MAG: hypothetical protein REI94_05695 [Moraxellaceae bacterium]|nr:hypothetical protein [Moraxellaceae bacterium]
MIAFLVRGAFVLMGATLIYETTQPVRGEQLEILSRSTREDFDPEPHQAGGTTWTLTFSGGQLRSCKVDRSAYDRSKPGDKVEVSYTPILKQCTHIARGSDVLYAAKKWKAFGILCGIFLIAVAVFRRSKD